MRHRIEDESEIEFIGIGMAYTSVIKMGMERMVEFSNSMEEHNHCIMMFTVFHIVYPFAEIDLFL